MSETIYRHTKEMGEISGFGGGYEACCQDMLEAGVKWLLENKNPNLKMKESPQIYGVLLTEGEDTKALEDTVLDAADGEATGAMHHAVMSRLMFIAQNGWDKYVSELEAREAEETQ